MQINPTGNTFTPVGVAPSTTRPNPTPTKQSNQDNTATVPAAVKQIMSRYDMTNITPNQLAKLGVALYAQNYISKDATVQFVVAGGDIPGTDPNKPFNAIEHFQSMLHDVNSEIQNGMTGGTNFAPAQQFLGDALSTAINLNAIAKPDQPSVPFHTVA